MSKHRPYWEREEGWDSGGNCTRCGEAARCRHWHKPRLFTYAEYLTWPERDLGLALNALIGHMPRETGDYMADHKHPLHLVKIRVCNALREIQRTNKQRAALQREGRRTGTVAAMTRGGLKGRCPTKADLK